MAAASASGEEWVLLVWLQKYEEVLLEFRAVDALDLIPHFDMLGGQSSGVVIAEALVNVSRGSELVDALLVHVVACDDVDEMKFGVKVGHCRRVEVAEESPLDRILTNESKLSSR